MNQHADFPHEANTYEKRIIITLQHANDAMSQLMSATWPGDKVGQMAYLMKADQKFRYVAMLCERLRLQAGSAD